MSSLIIRERKYYIIEVIISDYIASNTGECHYVFLTFSKMSYFDELHHHMVTFRNCYDHDLFYICVNIMEGGGGGHNELSVAQEAPRTAQNILDFLGLS